MALKQTSRQNGVNSTAPRPYYDRDRHILWLGDKIVKRYKQLAPVQELILCAFQDQGLAAPHPESALTGE